MTHATARPSATAEIRLARPHEVNWRDRPLTSMQTAAAISGVSTASLYRFASEGKLTLKSLAGRTLVETTSLVALIDGAEPWTPSSQTRGAVAARKRRNTDAKTA